MGQTVGGSYPLMYCMAGWTGCPYASLTTSTGFLLQAWLAACHKVKLRVTLLLPACPFGSLPIGCQQSSFWDMLMHVQVTVGSHSGQSCCRGLRHANLP